MTVVLAATLQTIRAHIAAGVLKDHGIEAWVWQDLSSSSYGAVSTGGCQLVVAEEDATEAAAVLNMLPPDAPAIESGTEAAAPPFTLVKAMGTGLLEGALNFPVLLFCAQFLWLVIYAIEQILSGHPRPVETPGGGFLSTILSLMVGGIFGGAILGTAGGIIAWHFVAWRRNLPSGKIFIWLITAVLLLPDIIGLIAILVFY